MNRPISLQISGSLYWNRQNLCQTLNSSNLLADLLCLVYEWTNFSAKLFMDKIPRQHHNNHSKILPWVLTGHRQIIMNIHKSAPENPYQMVCLANGKQVQSIMFCPQKIIICFKEGDSKCFISNLEIQWLPIYEGEVLSYVLDLKSRTFSRYEGNVTDVGCICICMWTWTWRRINKLFSPCLRWGFGENPMKFADLVAQGYSNFKNSYGWQFYTSL